jgi:hypothetical protein
VQPGSITRRFGGLVLAAACALAAVALTAAAEARFADAPEYLTLFAPRAARESYRTSVSPLALDAVLASLADDGSLLRPPGAWQPRAEPVQDAFGMGGDYNASTLARLYGGTQPRVARGPKAEGGRVAETWMLVSPYPDPSLRRLLPGTLRIAITIPFAGPPG